MEVRAVITSYGFMQASGVAGVFDLVTDVQFFDDNGLDVMNSNIVVSLDLGTMTQQQIQTAIINAIIAQGASMGFTLSAGLNQILIPQLNKV